MGPESVFSNVEILELVASLLPQTDRRSMCLVCTKWRDSVTSLCNPLSIAIKGFGPPQHLLDVLSGRKLFSQIKSGGAQFHELIIGDRRVSTASVGEGMIKLDYRIMAQAHMTLLYAELSVLEEDIAEIQRCLTIVQASAARPCVCVVIEIGKWGQDEYEEMRDAIFTSAAEHTRPDMPDLSLSTIPFVNGREPEWYEGATLRETIRNARGSERQAYSAPLSIPVNSVFKQSGVLMGIVRAGCLNLSSATAGSQICVGPYGLDEYPDVQMLPQSLGAWNLVDRVVKKAEMCGRPVRYIVPGMSLKLTVAPDPHTASGIASNSGVSGHGTLSVRDSRAALQEVESIRVRIHMVTDTRFANAAKNPVADPRLLRELNKGPLCLYNRGTGYAVQCARAVEVTMQSSKHVSPQYRSYELDLSFDDRCILEEHTPLLVGGEFTAVCQILTKTPLVNWLTEYREIPRPQSLGPIPFELPEEMWLSIVHFASVRALLNFGATCKTMYFFLKQIKSAEGIRLPQRNRLATCQWEKICIRFPEANNLDFGSRWMSLIEAQFIRRFMPHLEHLKLETALPERRTDKETICLPSVRTLTVGSGVSPFLTLPNLETLIYTKTASGTKYLLENNRPLTIILDGAFSVVPGLTGLKSLNSQWLTRLIVIGSKSPLNLRAALIPLNKQCEVIFRGRAQGAPLEKEILEELAARRLNYRIES